ncbi:MAG: AAA family ATPase [Actinobacteria bacterium]|nr:AAA family ATPase [Actinomycetota bacterium]
MITCPACHAENKADARFCATCGSSLVPACTRCGAELDPGTRFCSSCGQPVAELPEPGRERKIVTVLFADVTGSTALGEGLDPERLNDVMTQFFAAMREEIEGEGGTVEKYIGDAVMAAFGVPAAHEDDPARAVRAATRMLARLEDLNHELSAGLGTRIQMRVGINTGEVVAVTEPRPGEAMVTGDTVNVAARLEQSAEPGQVVLSERTARAARGFRYKEIGPVEIRGREEPVVVLELEAEAREAPERGLPGLTAPMVGREQELNLLQSVYRRVTSEGRPHLVTVYGDPGVGKSRLVREFEAWLHTQDPVPRILRGRCLPYGDGITYWPLAEILKSAAGVLDSDAVAEALRKVRDYAGSVLSDLVADPRRAADALAFTVGLEDPADDTFSQLAPRQVRLEAHAAWRSLFSALAASEPLVVVVEDIHWADPALLDLLEELADRVEGPALLLCPSRPELTQRRPGWGGGRRNATGVSLEPLSTEDARRLIGFLLAVEALPDAVRERILERAEGNPFFLEEILRQLIDEGRIVRAGDRWRAANEIGDVVIPDTVQGVLAARIDLLGPGEKRALQSAAVVGRVFWTGPVQSLLNGEGAELDDLLSRLESRELVSARLGSSIGGEREFMFKHVLTRDVAYGTLPRSERARAHARVAGWIESSAGGRQAEFAELLAYHYLEAYRGGRDATGGDPEETERLRGLAVSNLLSASRDASNRLALQKAGHLAEEAGSIATNGRERGRALERRGDAEFLNYLGSLAWSTYGEAIESHPRETEEERHAVARLCAKRADIPTRWPGSMQTTPGAEEVRAVIEVGMACVAPGDSTTRARLLVARAFWPFAFTSEVGEPEVRSARRDGEEAAAMALRLDRPDLASAALDALASNDLSRGDYGSQATVMGQRLALVPKLSDPFELGDIYAVASWGEFHRGRYRRAVELADEGIVRSESSPGVTLHCIAWRVLALVRLGDWPEALATLARHNEILGDRWEDPPGFALRAFGAAAYLLDCMGNRGAADRYLTVLLQSAETNEQRSLGGATSWVGELLARRGEFDRARTALDDVDPTVGGPNRGLILEARCELVAEASAWQEAGGVIDEARTHARESGLQALPAFADRLEGRAAQAAGRPDEAARALRQALDRFGALESVWEAARTRLDLASALVPSSSARARAEAEAALEDLERVGAVREIAHARDLLSSLE